MGSYFCRSSSVSIACFVLISFLVLTPSSAFDPNAICSQTLNPAWCSVFLYSNPRVNKSLHHSLARVLAEMAHSNATEVRGHIIQWQNRTDNPQLRERYSSCSSHFNDAVNYFKDAKQSVRLGDYNGLRNAASGAMGEFNGCAENFKQPPPEPSTLWNDNQDLLDTCSLILVISDILRQFY